MIRIDLHAHTRYSPDSTMTPAELVERARGVGLDRIAVTDHNGMDGAFEAWSLDPQLVIRGEEVDCADGTDIIGLFMTEPIPRGLPVEEVAARIRDQGGVVYAPHPFAYVRRQMKRALQALQVADVVEVFNARAFVGAWNRRAARAAHALGLPAAASTDAHFAHEIGNAYTELPAFSSGPQLRESLRSARAVGVRTVHPFIHARSLTTEALRRAWWSSPLGERPAYDGTPDLAPRPAAGCEATERGAA
ncbi:MAG: PHP-associated domain-containing protein [Longimicrobiales bacterium]